MLKHSLVTLTLGALLCAAASVVAQEAPSNDQPSAPAGAATEQRMGPGRFDPARRAEMLTKQLDLNADQQAKVQDVLKSEQSEMQKIHADSSLSQPDRRSKMMDLHKSSDDQIRSVLNADQQKKWDAMMTRREKWMEKRQHGAPEAAPPPEQK